MQYMQSAGTARGSAIVAARLAAGGGKYIPRSKPGAFVRQLKALVAGKKKDATDVARDTAAQSATTVSCLSSTTNFATAASGTGLFDMDGDEALINFVRIKQRISVACLEDTTPVALPGGMMMRTLVVYFKKPLLVASAAGTLPPITEVLVTDSAHALTVPDTQNSGRFNILYDKCDILGTNTVGAAAAGANPRINGVTLIEREFIVKVDKKSHFKVAGVSGTASGHYDSDVGPGQVDAGLLIMYCIPFQGDTNGTINHDITTRLNYTG